MEQVQVRFEMTLEHVLIEAGLTTTVYICDSSSGPLMLEGCAGVGGQGFGESPQGYKAICFALSEKWPIECNLLQRLCWVCGEAAD